MSEAKQEPPMFTRANVSQQSGNSCAAHAVKNAFCALGKQPPKVDLDIVDEDSKWMESQFHSNGELSDIKVLENYHLIVKRRIGIWVLSNV